MFTVGSFLSAHPRDIRAVDRQNAPNSGMKGLEEGDEVAFSRSPRVHFGMDKEEKKKSGFNFFTKSKSSSSKSTQKDRDPSPTPSISSSILNSMDEGKLRRLLDRVKRVLSKKDEGDLLLRI